MVISSANIFLVNRDINHKDLFFSINLTNTYIVNNMPSLEDNVQSPMTNADFLRHMDSLASMLSAKVEANIAPQHNTCLLCCESTCIFFMSRNTLISLHPLS